MGFKTKTMATVTGVNQEFLKRDDIYLKKKIDCY